MNANQLASVVRSSYEPVELTNEKGEEFLIGDSLTILEDEATSDDVILYDCQTGEILADGGYYVTADSAVNMGMWIA